MTRLITIKKDVEKLKQAIIPESKPDSYIYVTMAECLVADKEKIVRTHVDAEGRTWATIRVREVNP